MKSAEEPPGCFIASSPSGALLLFGLMMKQNLNPANQQAKLTLTALANADALALATSVVASSLAS